MKSFCKNHLKSIIFVLSLFGGGGFSGLANDQQDLNNVFQGKIKSNWEGTFCFHESIEVGQGLYAIVYKHQNEKMHKMDFVHYDHGKIVEIASDVAGKKGESPWFHDLEVNKHTYNTEIVVCWRYAGNALYRNTQIFSYKNGALELKSEILQNMKEGSSVDLLKNTKEYEESNPCLADSAFTTSHSNTVNLSSDAEKSLAVPSALAAPELSNTSQHVVSETPVPEKHIEATPLQSLDEPKSSNHWKIIFPILGIAVVGALVFLSRNRK